MLESELEVYYHESVTVEQRKNSIDIRGNYLCNHLHRMKLVTCINN
jgi:hypothetical protein